MTFSPFLDHPFRAYRVLGFSRLRVLCCDGLFTTKVGPPEPPDNSDPYDLGRFLAAQRDTYADSLAEIQSGRKHTHWMWFVFPQIQGLGSGENVRFFAISDADCRRTSQLIPVFFQRYFEPCAYPLSAFRHGFAARACPAPIRLATARRRVVITVGPPPKPTPIDRVDYRTLPR